MVALLALVSVMWLSPWWLADCEAVLELRGQGSSSRECAADGWMTSSGRLRSMSLLSVVIQSLALPARQRTLAPSDYPSQE